MDGYAAYRGDPTGAHPTGVGAYGRSPGSSSGLPAFDPTTGDRNPGSAAWGNGAQGGGQNELAAQAVQQAAGEMAPGRINAADEAYRQRVDVHHAQQQGTAHPACQLESMDSR